MGGVWGGVEVACDERVNLGKNKDTSFPRGTEAGIISFCSAVILAEVCLSYNLKKVHTHNNALYLYCTSKFPIDKTSSSIRHFFRYL